MVKLHADLVEMIAFIVRIKRKEDPGYSAAELVEPLLRPQIKARYERMQSDAEKIKKAEASALEKMEDEEQ